MKNISLVIRFGILTGVMLIVYFLLLSLFDLHTKPLYSYFNAFITAFGIYEVVRIYKYKDFDSFTFVDSFVVGLITGGLATFVFSAFFLLYITEINTMFLTDFTAIFPNTFHINAGLVTFTVAIMGFATTVVSSLCVMQYLKKSTNIIQTA